MPSVNKKYLWLVGQFEKEFKTKVEQEEMSNDQAVARLKESGDELLVQILKLPQVSNWDNGTWTDHYQVNLYIANKVPDARGLTDKVYSFLKHTLAGVDAGDVFLNTSWSDLQNYRFRLAVQEGV